MDHLCPDAPKIAILPEGATGNFRVVDISTDQPVFETELGQPKFWELSGETVTIADFSDFTTPGKYRLEHETAGDSYNFDIREEILRDLSKASTSNKYQTNQQPDS